LLEKNPEESSPDYGKPPEQRSVGELLDLGVVILDKPPGPSSHEATSWVRSILGAGKAGHAGTLDPQVSGVLPVALNRATRVLGLLLKNEKEYVGIIQFHRNTTEEEVRAAFKSFAGEITQTPPVKSAVKRVPRKRKVYYIDAVEIYDRQTLFKAVVEAGTYIRKLCFDMGKHIGGGANMLELRRTRSGNLAEDQAVTLHDLADALWLWREKNSESLLRKAVLPVEKTISLPRIFVRDSAIESICSGASLKVPGITRLDEGIEPGMRVAVLSGKGELVSVSQAEMGSRDIMEKQKGIAAKTIRVVMLKGTYPKSWHSETAGF